MYPDQKRTENGPEIYYFFKFQTLVLLLHFSECIVFEYFHPELVWPRTNIIISGFLPVYGLLIVARFSSLTASYILKVTKFLVKTSQFEHFCL